MSHRAIQATNFLTEICHAYDPTTLQEGDKLNYYKIEDFGFSKADLDLMNAALGEEYITIDYYDGGYFDVFITANGLKTIKMMHSIKML